MAGGGGCFFALAWEGDASLCGILALGVSGLAATAATADFAGDWLDPEKAGFPSGPVDEAAICFAIDSTGPAVGFGEAPGAPLAGVVVGTGAFASFLALATCPSVLKILCVRSGGTKLHRTAKSAWS